MHPRRLLPLAACLLLAAGCEASGAPASDPPGAGVAAGPPDPAPSSGSGPTKLLGWSGSGTSGAARRFRPFTAPAWVLDWSYECRPTAAAGIRFEIQAVRIGDDSGALAQPVRRAALSGAGRLDYSAGTYQLAVTAVEECSWNAVALKF